ncbi:MAG TPA: PP2C family protein-serine/threonine phosphatase, partial [Thermoanaerobaculia bacterium]|nr:PP2C family protein-serine/threonine phosphatase [Thermoanaerobaculia bacterium]
LIVRADRSVEPLSPTGPVIGLLPNAGWTSTTARLERGDALLLYTDGVIEATVDGEEFGLERLRDLAAAIAHRSADGIARAIMSAAPHHDDDTTVVVVQR